MKQNIGTWFKILKTAKSLNGMRQYVFYLSNLDVYRFIEYSNTQNLLETVKTRKKILDLGCGYSISPFLYSNINAIDINKKACVWQKKNGGEPVIADLYSMPIRSNSIDVVIAISSIEHVPVDRKVYTEINRILRGDGCIIMSVPYSPGKSHVIKGLRKGLAVKLLNSNHFERFWEIVLSKDNFHYFKEQTKTDFLNKVYGREELFSIIKEEKWEVEEELVFGKKPFRFFFKIFPPGWFVVKDLIFGFIFHIIDNNLENKNGNTILLKLRKSKAGTYIKNNLESCPEIVNGV